MRNSSWITLSLLGLNCVLGSAQEVVIQPVFEGNNPFAAPAVRSVYDFSNLLLARYDEVEGEPGLIFLMEQFREEEKQVTAMELKAEQRTRTKTVVRIVDGKQVSEEVEETYTVQVPVQVERTTKVKVPAGQKPKSVPLSKMTVYRLDGTEVTVEEVQDLLKQSTPVFVTNATKIEPADKLLIQALEDNVLVVSSQAIKKPVLPMQIPAFQMRVANPLPAAPVDDDTPPPGFVPAVQDFR